MAVLTKRSVAVIRRTREGFAVPSPKLKCPFYYLELMNSSNESVGFIDAHNHKVIRRSEAALYAHLEDAKEAEKSAKTRWNPVGYTVLLVTVYNH